MTHFDLALPGRGHSFALRPRKHEAVHFARRPGRFALVLDLVQGTVARTVETPDGRHFYGHGVYSPDGRLLYATENDFEAERGVIGVYGAERSYKRLGEHRSHGIGPHEIALLSDGETLVVANGGIATHPNLPRVKLNLPTMAPSLCYVDRRSGALRRELVLDPALHRLSIRHLAVGPEDTVAVAMQYEGPAHDRVPLVALQRGGGPLHLLQGPGSVLRAMKNYCGSVCFDPAGGTIAVSAPRGNLVTFWDVGTGRYLSSATVADGCGVAPGARAGEFLASSGLARISHHGHGLRGAVRPTEQESREARCGASGERVDARCGPESAALQVAPRRPPASSRASTVFPDTLFGPLLSDRTPGRDAGRNRGEKGGLGGVVVIDAPSGTTRTLALDGFETARWDNHLVAV